MAYTSLYVSKCVYLFICVCVYMHAFLWACVCVCMHVSVCMCVWVTGIYFRQWCCALPPPSQEHRCSLSPQLGDSALNTDVLTTSVAHKHFGILSVDGSVLDFFLSLMFPKLPTQLTLTFTWRAVLYGSLTAGLCPFSFLGDSAPRSPGPGTGLCLQVSILHSNHILHAWNMQRVHIW